MALKRKERRVPNGTAVSRKEYPRLTLSQALDFAVNAKRSEGLRERTLKDYAKDYGYFVRWLNENHPDIQHVDDISTQIIRDHVNWMKYDAVKYADHPFNGKNDHGVGLADTTINIRLRVLKALFNQLHRDEMIECNPADAVKLMRTDIDLTNCLTDDEVKSILAQINQRDYVGFRDYVAIVLMLDSGMRVSELLSLRIADIDFQTRFVTLPGERNKNRNPRLVPISPQSAKLLLQLIEENKHHFTTDRLFMSSFGEPLRPQHFNKRLKYYGKKSGISAKKMTAHVYRHTWAKNMILNGCDAFTLQKMGGWADIRTMRRYIQMDTSDVRAKHDEYSPANKFVRRRV